MSKFVGFAIGAALVVVGIATGNVALIIQGGTMIVSNAVLLLTMPKAPARNAAEMTIQLGEQPRSAIFGESFTAGSLVDGFNYGGKYGTKFEVLIIRLADHKCEGLTGFLVNDEYVEYTGDGDVPGFEDGPNAALRIYFRSDTTSQPLPSVVTTYGPGWSSSDIGASGCDVVMVYEADKPDEGKPEWPGGRPRFGFVVKGKLCYDPRLDSTVSGGSGSHRWDSPSTWEWSDNPAVCRYNWVRGIYANDQVGDPSQLLVGRGLSEAEAPPENIFAAANLCDELVSGEKRYRVSGPIYAGQPFIEVEEMFAAATGGSIVTREGSVELEPGAAKSVVASFTDDDLLSGSQAGWNQGVLSEASGEWVNTVVARYVEPTQHWRDHAAPVVRSIGDILADGRPRETSITLRLVRYANQALRVAEITRRLGRLWGRGSVTLGPRFCELEDGDWVQWTSARRFNGETKTFRVEAYSIDEKWHNKLTLREINSNVFGSATFLPDYSEVNQPAPPSDPDTPIGGTEWTLTAEMLTSAGADVPALVFTGAVADEDTSSVIFEYWKDDGVLNPLVTPDTIPWSAGGTFGPTVTRVEITSIQGGASYWGAVTYVQDGFFSARLVLGPVTVGEVDVSGQVAPLIAAAIEEAITGLKWKDAVRARTTAALPSNSYSNGTSGVGATLTGTANGALSAQDGVTLVLNERLLVANEATAARNGIYKVTQVGDASNPYILTRATDADEADELVNATVYVSEGTANADTQWTCTANAPITVGTTALAFGQSGGSGSLAVQDEGVAQGSAGTVNFTGSGVSASVSGGVATVNIPGAAAAAELDYSPPTLATHATERKTATSFTASASDVSGKGLTLNLNPTGAGDKVIARLKAAPSAPFTIIARLRHTAHNTTADAGIILYNSSNGRSIRLLELSTSQVFSQSWSGLETFNATIASSTTGQAADLHVWLKVTVDGSGNVAFFFSRDGGYWRAVGTTTLAAYLTAAGGSLDEVGVFARAFGSGGLNGVTFHYYAES